MTTMRERLQAAEKSVAKLTKELEDERKLCALYKKWYNDGLSAADKTRVSNNAALEKHRAVIESLVRTCAEIHETVVEARFDPTHDRDVVLGEVRKKILGVMTKETIELAFPAPLFGGTVATAILIGAGVAGLMAYFLTSKKYPLRDAPSTP